MKRVLVIAALLAGASTALANLAAYWNFEEGSGLTANDVSGNGQHAYLQAADSSSYPQWTAGRIGSQALLFNADWLADPNSINYLAIDPNEAPDDPNVLELGDAFTISMWVRRDTLSGDWAYLLFADAYDLELAIDPSGIGDPYDYFWSEAQSAWRYDIGISTESQQVGNWYHLAITCDNQVLKKYINGILVSSRYISPSINLPKATTPLYIACRAGNDRAFIGALDDVAIWAGTYLPAAEVAKLADQTATPLTVADAAPLPPLYFTLETALYSGGTDTLWEPDLKGLMSIVNNRVVYNTYWIFEEPGSRLDIRPDKWYVKDEETYENAAADISRYGMEWVDQSWNGRDYNMAVMAAYITPGLIFGQENHFYQPYNPGGYSWEDKPYFRTNIRVAAVNANGAGVRITVYKRSSETIPDQTNHDTLLTYVGEIVCPLDAGDRVWQHYEFTLPKPASTAIDPLWFEMAIVGGTEDTVLYIDALKLVSDRYVTFRKTDLSNDSCISLPDVDVLADYWLDTASSSMLDPRSGGLLANGDFSADIAQVLAPGATQIMNPTGWTFTGTGNYGIWNTSQIGKTGWYYSWANRHPVGGNVSAFTTDMFAGDPDGVLEQTASEAAVEGQTYYAMGYVTTYAITSPEDLGEWYGWRDTATMEIAVDGVVKATFSRKLSRRIWRPIYGTYTATAADAGKPIKIRFSYANTYTSAYSQSGNMLIGYAYLGTTVPNEWPEKRSNLLVNGGFEDLSAVQSYNPDYYTALTSSDNAGAWFVSGIPALFPNWIYEVPAGYDLNNQGGIRSSAYYSSPVPTPGMNDIVAYTSGTLVLGQIVGALTSGTTYYLDTACGVLVDPSLWGYATYTWPSPAPVLHIELWRIPAGVTDPAVIHTGVTTPLTGYVKIASADVASTGDIKRDGNKWQMIGTSYTATSADTNVYVRIYGTNPVSYTYPSFVFSDVYLSTEKRLAAGGSLINNVSSGVGAEVLGPYNCYQATLMGYTAPAVGDIDGDCRVNLSDLALLAGQWLEIGIAF
jgi:hypothetical protein